MAAICARILLLLLCRFTLCSGLVTWQDLKDNYYAPILEKYIDFTAILPRSFTNGTVHVWVSMNLASINSFDELLGYLEISGYLTVKWTETPVHEHILAEVDTSGNRTFRTLAENETVLVPISGIWTPPLLLMNSIKTTSTIGDASSTVRLTFQTGHCTWQPWMVIRGSCSPDVRYYPFDKQLCSFKFAAWGHTSGEISLSAPSSEWGMDFFEENGEWEITETSGEAYNLNNVPFVEFKIELQRRPTYYVINLLAPVILLGLLNVFVFVLPAESGERIGYSITCFLSYVVLLNTIMGFLPTTSAPLSYLSYYTFIMMIFSASMSLATIITMRIYVKNDSDPVPAFLRAILYVATCKCCVTTPQSNLVSSISGISIWDKDDTSYYADETYKSDTKADKSGHHDPTKAVTWKTVARVIDLLMFLGFLGGQIFYSVSFLLPMILAN